MSTPVSVAPEQGPEFSGSAGSGTPGVGPRRPPRVPRRRRVWLVAIALVLGSLAGLGNYALISAQHERIPVLVLTRDVGWGDRITAEDLGVTETAPQAVAYTIRASQRESVVGQTARASLPAGSMLTRAQLTSDPVPARGQRLIGLRARHLPARGLRAGDLVQVSAVEGELPGTRPSAAGSTGGAAFQARVATVGTPDANGVTTVDVVVPAETAREALQAAAGQVVVAVLGSHS